MKTLNPQPVLASSSDEFYDPFSEEVRSSTSKPHIQFEPVPCLIDGVHIKSCASMASRVLEYKEKGMNEKIIKC